MTIGLFVVVGFFLLLTVLVVGAGVMFLDLSGRCEEDAEWLQATVNDELRRDEIQIDDRLVIDRRAAAASGSE
jgi:hypothetical protein